jgi:hypothetical protein
VHRRWNSIPVTLLLFLGFAATACEPEVGRPCGPESFVNARMKQENGKNDIVQDIGFEACEQAFCASIDGSRPFCTRRCQTAIECPDNFTCGRIVNFGRMACEDYTEESDCVQPDGTPSERPKLYCVAERQVIQQRDCDFNRGDAALCQTLVDQETSE